MTTTYFVGFGYSIGNDGEVLSPAARQDFLSDVVAAIESVGGDIFSNTIGNGRWVGDDGVEVIETCSTVGFTAEDLPGVFEDRLARLATKYGQEAIALTTGSTTFVSPA